ncbi:hypothetical protein CYCD_08030 [Tenuifilaceae bacterium CYCD]|nr:hypothetical protein CYCD_08030 [Tenuifilaceae bacterium CYCD]
MVKDTLVWVNLAADYNQIIIIALKRIIILAAAGLFVLALFPRCAKVVSPTGGPKDTLAPVMVNSTPKINATNFTGNKITFEFNEYIQVKDIQQKLLVSPPLKTQPQVNLKGKKILLEISDTLKENTTYTVYLGDAISDNNEGNPINSFEFAFSTGSTIDTLTLKGSVVNSFTQKPVEGALIMLYSSFADSLPYNSLPVHIAKTNKKGEFKVNNLKYNNYKLVAITDANSNYKYNQGAEEIAFLDKPLKKEDLASSKIALRTFTEELPNQIITGYDRPDKRLLQLNFSRKPHGGFKLKSLDEPTAKDWFILEPDAQGDTVKVWLASDKLTSLDTLRIIAEYKKTDSLNVLNPQTDTLKFVYYNIDNNEKPSKSKKKDKGKDEEVKTSGFELKTSIKGGQPVIPDIPVEFTLPLPAKKTDASKVLIFNETDSIMEPSIKLSIDSLNPRIYRFNKDWKANASYKMLILPGTFQDLSSLLNDTLKLQFYGADPEKFGTLIIKTSNVAKGIVAELLTDKGDLVIRKSAIGNKTITFTYITPGKYKLRFVEDLNQNGTWDTGNYLKKIQPERIFEFTEGKNKGEINIRANWESEISFSIPKP